jgi:hypothetical protein
MAEKTPKVTEKTAAADTQRIVLKRERAIVLPEDIDEAALLEALKQAKIKAMAARDVWVPVGRFKGATMRKAIRQHTGEPNQPDTKVGTWKAISLTNWRGGEVMVAPPKPLVVAKPLED